MKYRAIKFFAVFAFLNLIPAFLYAQLCNNNLGDPIINVTFGTKDARDIPDLADYEYVGGCPSKGQFTINDFLFGCGGYWVQMTGDHTSGDINGNYMLIDAESTPGIIHQDTASDLCGGMTYQYATYVTNVMQDNLTCSTTPVLPNISFNVETLAGTVIASYNTGDVPITNEKKWVQYGFTFQTPPNVNSVILKLVANSKPGCGNAFAIDDITLQNCGPLVNVTIDGSTSSQSVCADYTNPFVMQGSYSPGFTDPVVQWQNSMDTGKTWSDIPGATLTTYAVPRRQSGVIEFRMVVAERGNINSPNCRIRSNNIYTAIYPVPVHNPPQTIYGCTGKDYLLPRGDPRSLDIKWTGPNGYSSTLTQSVVPLLQNADTGLYKLQQNFSYGCTSLDSFYLKVTPGIVLSVQPAYPICETESENLIVTASAKGSFKWTPALGLSNDTIPNPVAHPLDSTIYKVIVTNANGCQDSAFLPVDVYRKPVADAGIDKVIVTGDTATLNGSVKGTAVNYYWSPSLYINDANSIQPQVSPPQEMLYTLHVSSAVGCGITSDDVLVKVYQDIFIPNSFTPNGDGKNDRFRILPYDNYQLIKLDIYNRWGKLVFRSADINEGWDGNFNGIPQSIGAYIYNLQLQNTNGKKIFKQGTVLLLR